MHSSAGHSDLEVETADGIYIFEFKVGAKLVEAINQIKGSVYAEKQQASIKNIFLIRANISQNKRTLD